MPTAAPGPAALLLVPAAVLLLALLVAPVLVTRWRQWRALPGLLAASAGAAGVAFVLLGAHAADANPSGGAEGALGTDVPGLLLPPAALAVLALLTGARRTRTPATHG